MIFRWAFRLLILLIVLLVAVVLLLDTIVRAVAEYRIRSETGLEVKIGSVDVGILNPRMTIEHFVIYNSAEFGGSPLIDLPELHVEYDRHGIFSRNVHLRLVRFNLASVSIVEDKKGNINFEVLEKRLKRNETEADKKNRPPSTMRIDTLNLTLGKATFLTMKQPGQVDTLRMEMRNQVLTNVTSAEDLQGIEALIWLKNGIPLGGTNHWQYWIKRFSPEAKK